MRKEITDPVVLAKKEVAVRWCARASAYFAACGGKSWTYVLVPHDVIAENVTLGGLAERFACREA